jgi:alkylated DNA nucleotide flippase Atl1
VNAKGELAGKYVFGGAWKQAELLLSEGVEVQDGRVDLMKYQWNSSLLTQMSAR